MKFARSSEGTLKHNSLSCEVKEFGNIGAIDGADIIINGRYPEQGWSLNAESSFVVRVIKGTGILAVGARKVELVEGDTAFVENSEPYYFEGKNFVLFMASTPAWNPDQYSNVE